MTGRFGVPFSCSYTRMNTTKQWMAFLAILFVGMITVVGQVTNVVVDDSFVLPSPADTAAMLNLLIAVITPFVVALIGKAAATWLPKVPKIVLPLIAPFVGVAVAYALNLAGLDVTQGLGAAVWGAVGVWVREIADQTRKMSTSQLGK